MNNDNVGVYGENFECQIQVEVRHDNVVIIYIHFGEKLSTNEACRGLR